jgi:hypothetical protein
MGGPDLSPFIITATKYLISTFESCELRMQMELYAEIEIRQGEGIGRGVGRPCWVPIVPRVSGALAPDSARPPPNSMGPYGAPGPPCGQQLMAVPCLGTSLRATIAPRNWAADLLWARAARLQPDEDPTSDKAAENGVSIMEVVQTHGYMPPLPPHSIASK